MNKIKAAIIEDEIPAARLLKDTLLSLRPDWEVQLLPGNIEEAVEWFGQHPHPDILFLDIQLTDGNSFLFIEQAHPESMIVFTTAYDEYALRAFKVNSIDYLLKPIGKEDIEHSFEKLNSLNASGSSSVGKQSSQDMEWLQLIHSLKKQENYKTHFLIPLKGDKLLPVSVDMIQLFYIKDCQVKAVLTDGTEHYFPQTLDELAECLNPALFFRANRQYLISREAIKDIDLWFNSRLSINLRYPSISEKILVSKARVTEFKEWFARKKCNKQ